LASAKKKTEGIKRSITSMIDQAYLIGVKEGIKQAEEEHKAAEGTRNYTAGYDLGRDDAWNIARKAITRFQEGVGNTTVQDNLVKALGANNPVEFFQKNSVKQAAAKLNAYEKTVKGIIKVGDHVVSKDGKKHGVVFVMRDAADKESLCVLSDTGSLYDYQDNGFWVKETIPAE